MSRIYLTTSPNDAPTYYEPREYGCNINDGFDQVDITIQQMRELHSIFAGRLAHESKLDEPAAECSCGKAYTLRTWRGLAWVRVQQLDDGEPILELRNCTCGSTISVEVKQ